MEDTSVGQGIEQKTEQVQTHHEPHCGEKKRPKFMIWLKGKNRQEFIGNLSYVVILASAAMLFIGIGLGSFVQYVVFLGAAGALLVLIGIILYIVSQLMAPAKEGTGSGASSSGSVKVVNYRTDLR